MYQSGLVRSLDDNGGNMMVFSGNANRVLAKRIVGHLGLDLGKAIVEDFSDGEIMVEISENVRGKDVFIVQPTCSPPNRNLMQLLIMADALRRASAKRVTAVIPYYGYSRQDRRVRSARVPITAKMVADMICRVGVDRVLTVDLHAEQIQGFFEIPVDNVYASPVFLSDIWRRNYEDLTVVSPDVGGVVRARALAKQLGDADLAIIDKRRPRANVAKVMHVIGEVEERTCILHDDIVDTAGTLTAAAAALKENGAKKVMAYCTHPVLSGKALENISDSALDQLVVTDTIPLHDTAASCEKIRFLSISETLAEAMRRVHHEESVSSLFMD